MKTKGILVLLLLSYVTYQQTAVISVNAIVPCTINFTFDSGPGAYQLTECTYFLPGTNITYTETSQCWLYCCPGLAQPPNTSYQDYQSCATTYSTQPFLVTLIGILIGILLVLVFVCIPCLCTKDGIFLCVKKAFQPEEPLEELEPNAGELSPIRDVFIKSTKDFELKMSDQVGSQYVLQEEPVRISLDEEIIDEMPSEARVCTVCKEGKANLHLNCKHKFHSQCLPKTAELHKCHECSSDKIHPLRGYCSICERRFGHLNRAEPHHIYICKTCEEK